jgi:tetratricopeptide (TPR) repeat protein
LVITTLLTYLLFAVVVAGTEGDSNADLITQAEAAFRGGMEVRDNPEKARPLFRKAASCYEELHRRGCDNADLYRNQGNCYLLAGDLPRAILSYRHGLRLAPTDSVLRANLFHAREQVVYPARGDLRPPANNVPPWLLYLSPPLSLLLFGACYSLGWFGFVRWWMVGRTAPLSIGIVAFLLAALPAAGLALEEWSERDQSLHPVVVVAADGVLLRRGNGVLYPPRLESPLNRGVEASLQFERGPWLQIELTSGVVGWVPRTAVLLDPL